MSLRDTLKIVTIIMALISISVFLILLMISTAKSDWQKQTSSVKNFKDYMTNMIKEQSTKIQSLLKKIQTNAQSVLEKIENMKQDAKTNKKKTGEISKKKNENVNVQVESPILKTRLDTFDSIESRNFNNHYQTTSYGASANANYGALTYHHHSIGFDPINIMVSVSLLSFLLQALQGLLTRSRFPTPVVEAKSLNAIEDWTKTFEDKVKDKYYLKKKYLKKYYE